MADAGGIRAGKAFVELSAKDATGAGLKAIAAKLSAFGKQVAGIGARLAGLGAAAITPLLLAAKSAAESGEQMELLSRRTGISVESLSSLGYAAEQSGADLSKVLDATKDMTRNVQEAAGGNEQATETFTQLGLSANSIRNLRMDEQFLVIAERLAEIPDPGQRAAASMKIFGEAGNQLLPMMSSGAQGIERLRSEALRLGLVMSGPDAKATAEFSRALRGLWDGLKKVWFQVGAALAPSLTKLADIFSNIIAGLIDWIKKNQELIVSLAKGLAAVVAIGAALIALGGAIAGVGAVLGTFANAFAAIGLVTGLILKPLALIGAMVSTVIGLFTGMVGVISTVVSTVVGLIGTALGGLGAMFASVLVPIGLVAAAITGLAYAFSNTFRGAVNSAFSSVKDSINNSYKGVSSFFSQIGSMSKAVFSELFTLFGDIFVVFKDSWGGILNAIRAGRLDLAFKVAIAGLKLSWQTAVNWLSNKWEDFKVFFVTNFGPAVYKIGESLIRGWSTAQQWWTRSMGGMQTLWASFTGGVARWMERRDRMQRAEAQRQRDREAGLDEATVQRNYDAMVTIANNMANAVDQVTAQEIVRITQQENAAITQIEQNRDQQIANLNATVNEGSAERQARRRELENQANAELSAAQAEFRGALAEANAVAIGGNGRAARQMPGVDQINQMVQQKTSTAGSFTFDARAMGISSDLASRTATATERTADNTNRILTETRNARSAVFA
jgi:TP901 family phage tail tape measure protein